MIPIQRLKAFFSLLALIFFCTSLSLNAQTTGTVEGTVVDAKNDAPLTGVTVTLIGDNRRRGTSTNAEGNFQFSNIAYGDYTLKLSFVGYRIATQDVTLDQEEVTLQLRLNQKRYGMDEVIISATRELESREDIPASVTSISSEEMEQQAAVTSDLGTILSQKTPGLAPSTQSLSNYGQTLRGRSLSVLIDGVPQSTPLRDVLRDLRSIDPQAIKRVEVIRGSSAAYGYGATGGLVNIITRGGTAEKLDIKTDIGTRFSTQQPDGSFGYRFNQQIGGRSGAIDYNISGTYEKIGSFFDAEGDRIPIDPHGQGGLANSNEYSLSANLGYQLNDSQELRFTGSFYDIKQDVDFITNPGVPGEEKATAEPVDDAPGESPGTDNISLNLEFTDNDILNSNLSAKVYYQDYDTRFGFATFFPGGGGQSFLTSEKFGSRLNIKTPIGRLPGSYIQWGADYLTDETAQPLVDGREWVPPIRQSSIAPFAQLKIQPGEKLILRGGLRYENISLDVEDFTTLFGGNEVAGGDLNYDALVANTGIVFFMNDMINVYASFSQAFSVSDVGRELRGTSAASVEQLNPEAQKVNNYETGIRASGNFWAATVSGYINTSDLGTTFSGGNDFSIVRSPEIVRGLETTLDLKLRRDLEIGGTFSLLEGKRDSDDDGSYDTFLTGDRIPPSKLTGYLAYSPLEGLRTRLDVLYSGNRNKFPGSTSFAQGEVNSYTVVDLSAGYNVGPGTLSLGIENLFNNQYFPTISQWYNLGGTGYSAGRGRMVSLGYQLDL